MTAWNINRVVVSKWNNPFLMFLVVLSVAQLTNVQDVISETTLSRSTNVKNVCKRKHVSVYLSRCWFLTGGVFVVLLCGLSLAIVVAMLEFCWNSRKNAQTDRVSVY